MNGKTCIICASKMKRNGKTKAGKQRWRCSNCGYTTTHEIESEHRDLNLFISWLMSKKTQDEMPGGGRTFRRKTSKCWDYWALPMVDDEVHKFVYIDGIHIGEYVILIACTDEYVVSWHLAKYENSSSWKALMSRIAPPEVVICDGGLGFKKALNEVWPDVRVQRCLFHVSASIKRKTTRKPKTLAGVELLTLANQLLHIETVSQAYWWTEQFYNWCDFWKDELDRKISVNGKKQYQFKQLRAARSELAKLIRDGSLFMYLSPDLNSECSIPRTNNMIEGGVNSQIRAMIRVHRGMSTIRRIKAAFWWCYMHTECPLSTSEILKRMPTDNDIDILNSQYATCKSQSVIPDEWGTGIQWSDFHAETPYPFY